MRPLDPVWRFALRVLALLAPAFLAWYLVAPWYDLAPAWLARGYLALWREGLVSGLEVAGRLLTFVTTLEIAGEAGQRGLLTVEVNPMVYTFGAALLAALLVASRVRWPKIVLGIALLAPFQAWGIAFDVLAQILHAHPELAASAGADGAWAPVAALAYQVGSLVLPCLVPVVLWGAFAREFVTKLMDHAGRGETAAVPPPV